MQTDTFKATRQMILLRVLLVPFVTVLLVFGTLVYYFATTLRSQEETELTRIADGHRSMIESFLKERALDLQYVASARGYAEISSKDVMSRIFSALRARWQAFFDIGVFDEEGNHVVYIGPYDLEGKNYAQTEWFLRVQEEGVYISDVFLGYRNVPHFVIAVRRNEGDRVWYLRATIDSFFFNELVEDVRIGSTGEAYIINRQGVLQTRRRSGGSLMDLDVEHAMYAVGEKAIASFSAKDRAGTRYLYATGKIAPTEWLLVVRQSINDAYAPLFRAVLIAITITFGGGAIVVSMAFFLASGVANQLALAEAEKRRMGTQLIMAGKLAEVGEMSAGVAHEINNPLQVIKSEETYMRDILDEIEQNGLTDQSENFGLLRESLDQLGLMVDRGRRITTGLLGFARQSETTIQTVNLRELIPAVVGMVDHRAELENIRIVQEFDTELPAFRSDPAELQQIFLNLLNNAIDAVKEKGKGEIRVAAIGEDSDIIITITDDGCGIAPDHIEKIFMPFFTTKPVGQGTGLGLSTCYGIIDRLGGKISVSSELHVGSVFTIRFPVAGPPGEKSGPSKDREKESMATRAA